MPPQRRSSPDGRVEPYSSATSVVAHGFVEALSPIINAPDVLGVLKSPIDSRLVNFLGETAV